MIRLEKHHEEWATNFRSEADRLLSALNGQVDLIEHIGSTAVPGLVSKPIIDLAARAATGTDSFGLAVQLEALGYEAHTAGPKSHAIYIRATHGRRTHILHVFAWEEWDTCNQRLFRDKLLRDTSARKRYADLKRASSHLEESRAYTSSKTSLIEELLNEERAARDLPPTNAWDK